MTTAHRPTWAPAIGGEEQGGMRIFVPSRAVSAKNQPGHLKLKFRQDGQTSVQEQAERDFRAELEQKEKQHFDKKKGIDFEEERKKDLLLLEAAPPDASAKPLIPKNQDADDEDDSDEESDSDDDDDDDDEEELLKLELERIKKERAEEAARKAREEAERLAKEKEAELVTGNPLLNIGGGDVTFAVKRRWDEDVVFKNQSRGEPKQQKRFVNDTIRNDFHRRFLQRYMR